MQAISPESDASAAANITQRIQDLADWRDATLARVRRLIHDAEPATVEEWKWRAVPVWSRDGVVCTGKTYKQIMKLTFARGAALDGPARLFNASLEGNTRRAIDQHKGEAIDEAALKQVVRAAVAANHDARALGSARRNRPNFGSVNRCYNDTYRCADSHGGRKCCYQPPSMASCGHGECGKTQRRPDPGHGVRSARGRRKRRLRQRQ